MHVIEHTVMPNVAFIESQLIILLNEFAQAKTRLCCQFKWKSGRLTSLHSIYQN
jgi:hypothetical protein